MKFILVIVTWFGMANGGGSLQMVPMETFDDCQRLLKATISVVEDFENHKVTVMENGYTKGEARFIEIEAKCKPLEK